MTYSYLRFSTPEQSLGDSERRQLEKAAAWAKAHNEELDSSLRDLGISGYRGKNRRKGALSRFLKLIKENKVPPNSYFLVEDLDRLSREHPFDSIDLVKELVRSGITLVVLKNNREYTEKSLRGNGMEMTLLTAELERGSGESERKSTLSTDNWKGKRKILDHKILTARGKDWLTAKADKTGFEIIPERVAIIRQIFEWHLNGLSVERIAAKINDAGTEPWGSGGRKGRAWHASYVRRILTSRATLGEFQPHKVEHVQTADGWKRTAVPVGPPIPNYYPAILEEKTFDQVKFAARPHTGGKINKKVSNLFNRLIFERENGAPIHYASKGNKVATGKKNPGKVYEGRYLCSNTAGIKPKIPRGRWPYQDVEFAILHTLSKTDWLALAEEAQPQEHRAHARRAAQLETLAADLLHQADNIATSVAQNPSPALLRKLAAIEQEQEKTEKEAAEVRRLVAAEDRASGTLRHPLPLDPEIFKPTNCEARLAFRDKLAQRISRIELSRREGSRGPFTISIQFANGVWRYIRVTPRVEREPIVSSLSLRPNTEPDLSGDTPFEDPSEQDLELAELHHSGFPASGNPSF